MLDGNHWKKNYKTVTILNSFAATFLFIFAIIFIILIHESGHYIVARWLNIQVERFSIGFGKTLFTRISKSGTAFVLTYFPLGGYIKLSESAFKQEAFWKRILVVLAGPAANILLAFVFYWIIYCVGYTMPKPIIAHIIPNTIAAAAHLQPEDEITHIANVPVQTWQDVLFALLPYYGDDKTISIQVKNISSQQENTRQLRLSAWHLHFRKQQKVLISLGIKPWEPIIPAVIQQLKPGAITDLKAHDLIISSNGLAIDSWQAWLEKLKQDDGRPQTLQIERDSQMMKLIFKPQLHRTWLGDRYIALPFSPPRIHWPKDKLRTVQYSFFESGLRAAHQTWTIIVFNADIMGKLVTGKLSFKILAGPISLFKSIQFAGAQGLITYLMLLALVSISLGLINLIPIPGLDGGHALIILGEKILNKKMPVALQLLLYRFGLIIIFILLVQALANDIVRI